MKRGRQEADGPKSIEKFCAVYDLYKRGYITHEEASRVFQISVYVWKKWVEKYGSIDFNLSCTNRSNQRRA